MACALCVRLCVCVCRGKPSSGFHVDGFRLAQFPPWCLPKWRCFAWVFGKEIVRGARAMWIVVALSRCLSAFAGRLSATALGQTTHVEK